MFSKFSFPPILIKLYFFLVLIYVYPFLVYPLLLFIFSFIKRKFTLRGSVKYYPIAEDKLPSVSLIICAYNEEGVIAKKITNSLNISYPKDKLEIVVVSDGSTDQTVSKAKNFLGKGVKVIEIDERKGKTYAQNIGVDNSSGEILVFSDANTFLEKDSLKNIVNCLLSSDEIGCVSGVLVYKSSDGGYGESRYQRIEDLLKKLETEFFSLVGSNGAFYSVRRVDYIYLPPDIISDFVEPLEIYRIKGKTSRLCKEAIAFEEEPYREHLKGIIKRKSRILLRGLYGLMYERALLNPFKYPQMSFELISHKLIKWVSPLLLLAIYVAPLLSFSKQGLLIFGIFNLLLLMLVFIHYISKTFTKKGVFNFLIYFLAVNVADMIGWFYFLTNRKITTWETKGR